MDVVGVGILLVVLLLSMLWVAGVIDALWWPAEHWREAGHSKAGWVARLLLVGWFAGAVYLFAVRPALVAAESGALSVD